MHELALCSAIARIAERTAAGRKVERVHVDVGHLRQVVPDTLRYSWEMVVFETSLEGAELDVRYVPAVIECRDCGDRTELSELSFRCASCESVATDVVAGNELLVTALEVVRTT